MPVRLKSFRASQALLALSLSACVLILVMLSARPGRTTPLSEGPARLFQGPVADALTHVGQIAMLRRMAVCPISGENYFVAQIETGRVGADQAAAVREF